MNQEARRETSPSDWRTRKTEKGLRSIGENLCQFVAKLFWKSSFRRGCPHTSGRAVRSPDGEIVFMPELLISL